MVDDHHFSQIKFQFHRLTKLKISICRNLMSFPPCLNLETLEEWGNDKSLQIMVETTNDVIKLRDFRAENVGYLKSLPSGCISGLVIEGDEEVERLSKFGEEVFETHGSYLRRLHISSCKNLRRLNEIRGLKHITVLEELLLDNDKQLGIEDDDDEPWKSFHNSLCSLSFMLLPNMTRLPKGMHYLTSLKKLRLEHCENVKALPELISSLSSLRSLYIWGCPALKSLPQEIQNVTSLHTLDIRGCPELMERCKEPNGEDLPKIQNIAKSYGAKIPSLGFGTYRTPPHIVAAAIKLGYRHIDCAHIYGNEKQIGVVLKELFEEGIVKREDLYITSKLWNADHEPEDVPKALDKTLNDLQLEYLDLYLIHWPVKEKKGLSSDNVERFLQADIPNTWKAMEALYDSGKVRAIGVSNFSAKTLDCLLEVSRIVPAVNQVECHPMWQQPKLREYCKSKGIHLSAYSPLGSQSSDATLKGVLINPILNKVAEELGKSPAQVALRWGLQQGHSVLPKTSNEERLKNNLDIFNWFIPQNLLYKFSEISQEKFLKATQLGYEASARYITLEELWDDQV